MPIFYLLKAYTETFLNTTVDQEPGAVFDYFAQDGRKPLKKKKITLNKKNKNIFYLFSITKIKS